MFASFLVLLALLSLLLPSCSFCPRVSLHIGPLSQQRLCVQMAIDAEKTVDDLIKLADRMHLYSDSKARFVAMILAMQNEVAKAQVQKDHELAQAQAGKDRKFELQLAEKDHQLKVAERDHKFELELAQSYRHSQISAISKRFVCSGRCPAPSRRQFAFPKSR